VIARVKVVAIAVAQADSEYTKLARVRVIDVVKGAKVGDSIEILSEQKIVACPYVDYSLGDDCIVVLKRRPNGSFETKNFTAGKFEIKDGKIEVYPLWRSEIPQRSEAETRRDIQRGDFRNKSPAEFIEGLRRLLPEVEKEMQNETKKAK
jgi:hypothetical protein